MDLAVEDGSRAARDDDAQHGAAQKVERCFPGVIGTGARRRAVVDCVEQVAAFGRADAHAEDAVARGDVQGEAVPAAMVRHPEYYVYFQE